MICMVAVGPHGASGHRWRRVGCPGWLGWLVAGVLVVAARAADPYRGLWVGEVTVTHVNEVSVPMDAQGVPRAPDPRMPTATADQAHLRLILHVDGAGQVRLLRDVALLRRDAEGGGTGGEATPLRSESEVALVTDARLYGEFPPQPAMRWASAAFDFGDSQATAAVDWLVDAVVEAAATFVNATAADLTTTAGRFQATTAAASAASAAGSPRVPLADASVEFGKFLANHLNRARVSAIAAAPDPASAPEAALARTAAEALRDGSFYQDTRGLEMLAAVVHAAEQAAPAGAVGAAQNSAAAYADVADDYHRFLAGKAFGALLIEGAKAAAAAVGPGVDELAIRTAVGQAVAVQAARDLAVSLRVAAYDDRRASLAVEQVIDAMVGVAVAALPGGGSAVEALAAACEQEGRVALATRVKRYARPVQVPSTDYDRFVRSPTFAEAVATAAQAAAAGAVAERRNNPPPFSTLDSLRRAARAAAVGALRLVYVAAAGARQTALPLDGRFGLGEGDPRLTASVGAGDPPLGAAALEGTLRLAASHPTNPFRHRRHPDHRVGFDVTRKLRLDFDGEAGGTLERAGYGVDRITGVYREEILGLHKPLGPARDVGLRVEGKFQLQRLALIETLNAR